MALGLESAEAREQLQASRLRMLEAGLEERRRLERNLHDGAQQRLVSLALHLHLLETQLAGGPERTRLLVSGARRELDLAMKELRELARGLHPAVLTERGLAAGLASLAKGAALDVRVHGATDERLDEAVEACLYFVAAESITNAVRYAEASSVDIRVRRLPGAVTDRDRRTTAAGGPTPTPAPACGVSRTASRRCGDGSRSGTARRGNRRVRRAARVSPAPAGPTGRCG